MLALGWVPASPLLIAAAQQQFKPKIKKRKKYEGYQIEEKKDARGVHSTSNFLLGGLKHEILFARLGRLCGQGYLPHDRTTLDRFPAIIKSRGPCACRNSSIIRKSSQMRQKNYISEILLKKKRKCNDGEFHLLTHGRSANSREKSLESVSTFLKLRVDN